MPFPTVSQFRLMALIMVGGGVTAVATSAAGIGEPLNSILSSTTRVEWEGDLVQLNDRAIGRLFSSVDESARYSQDEDIIQVLEIPFQDGNRILKPEIPAGHFLLPTSGGGGEFFNPNLDIQLLASEGEGDLPFPGGGAHKPIPIPMPPGGLALAMGAAALGLSRRARVR